MKMPSAIITTPAPMSPSTFRDAAAPLVIHFPVSSPSNAVAMAGGLTELANPKKVSINRKGTVTVVDFREISQRGDRPFLLQPDDVITVAERLF